jgi:hypothetical protein
MIEVKVAWCRCWNDESGGETNTLYEVYLDAEKKCNKECNYVMDKLEKQERIAERVIKAASSLEVLHNDVFKFEEKILRNDNNRNQDKQAVAIFCKRMVRKTLVCSRIIWLRKWDFSIEYKESQTKILYIVNELFKKVKTGAFNLPESTIELINIGRSALETKINIGEYIMNENAIKWLDSLN